MREASGTTAALAAEASEGIVAAIEATAAEIEEIEGVDVAGVGADVVAEDATNVTGAICRRRNMHRRAIAGRGTTVASAATAVSEIAIEIVDPRVIAAANPRHRRPVELTSRSCCRANRWRNTRIVPQVARLRNRVGHPQLRLLLRTRAKNVRHCRKLFTRSPKRSVHTITRRKT